MFKSIKWKIIFLSMIQVFSVIAVILLLFQERFDIYIQREMLTLSLLLGVAASAVFGLFLGRMISRPIRNLTRHAEKYAQGDYDSRVEVRARDELGKLARTFNYMSGMIRQAINQVEQERKKMETVLQHMTDGVMAFDHEGELILMNSEAEKLFVDDSNPADNIVDDIPTHFDGLFRLLGVDVCIEEFTYLDQLNVVERELSAGDKHYNLNFAQFKSEAGGGVVVVFQDMTDAQQLEKIRREFVANVSHELRTPLTTTKGYAETMLEGLDGRREQERKYLTIICNEVDRMTRIVRDLLTLSTLGISNLASNKEYFSLDELLRQIVETFEFEAEIRGQKLTYDTATPLPQLYADRDRIEQVIVNILANAMRYTPETMGVVNVCSGYLYNEIYVKVKDNGIGIPPKDLPRIFERFYRVDKARSRDHGGTGLGLSIAQEIVKLHNGSISISSHVGQGTEVIVKLPVVGGE